MSGHVHTARRAGLFTKEGKKTVLSEKRYKSLLQGQLPSVRRKGLVVPVVYFIN